MDKKDDNKPAESTQTQRPQIQPLDTEAVVKSANPATEKQRERDGK